MEKQKQKDTKKEKEDFTTKFLPVFFFSAAVRRSAYSRKREKKSPCCQAPWLDRLYPKAAWDCCSTGMSQQPSGATLNSPARVHLWLSVGWPWLTCCVKEQLTAVVSLWPMIPMLIIHFKLNAIFSWMLCKQQQSPLTTKPDSMFWALRPCTQSSHGTEDWTEVKCGMSDQTGQRYTQVCWKSEQGLPGRNALRVKAVWHWFCQTDHLWKCLCL